MAWYFLFRFLPVKYSGHFYKFVIPAKAGIQPFILLGSRFRGSDEKMKFQRFPSHSFRGAVGLEADSGQYFEAASTETAISVFPRMMAAEMPPILTVSLLKATLSKGKGAKPPA